MVVCSTAMANIDRYKIESTKLASDLAPPSNRLLNFLRIRKRDVAKSCYGPITFSFMEIETLDPMFSSLL